jgi:predicted AlkP superfamily pyrophosphatase or phosphodiesterase
MVRSTVLFVIDGLRPDGLQQAETPHIDDLIARGAHTYNARTVMPSATLPCHTSMFRGVAPGRHGITTNTWVPQVRPVPSLFGVVHAAGHKTASFYNWEQLRDLSDPGSLDRSVYLNNCYDPEGDGELADIAAEFLARHNEGFTFVYLGYTDVAGHESGWMSAPYLEAIGRADRAIGRVLEALDEETCCIVTSDHGGHDQTHGTQMDEDMTIPWIACGPGVPTGHQLIEPVAIIDNPPTIATLLGVEPARDWAGKVVGEVIST